MSWLKSFRWKKPQTNEIFGLAAKLGLERRQNVRVRYPSRGAVAGLPTVSYGGIRLKIQDISIGGCCLRDPQEVLGPTIGQDLILTMDWNGVERETQCRIVARIDSRRHIQFLDLDDAERKKIADCLKPGVRGLFLKRAAQPCDSLLLEAAEIWYAISEDSLSLFDHPHLSASVVYEGETYCFYRESMPVRESAKDVPVSDGVYDELVLFLANIPNPSPRLIALLDEVYRLREGRFR